MLPERPQFPIPRLSEERMRELVVGIVNGQILTSEQVDSASRNLVFLPIALGALGPTPELRKLYLGSEGPPDVLEGEPLKPQHPGYPDEPVCAEKPTLEVVDPQMASDVEWGDAEEEELKLLIQEVDERNRALIREWDRLSLEWQKELEAWGEKCKEIDLEYSLLVKSWEDSLDDHKDKVDERNSLRESWVQKHDETFQDWMKNLGVVYGDIKDSFPRSINGYPMFHAIGVVHKDDWERVRKATEREWEREKTLQV